VSPVTLRPLTAVFFGVVAQAAALVAFAGGVTDVSALAPSASTIVGAAGVNRTTNVSAAAIRVATAPAALHSADGNAAAALASTPEIAGATSATVAAGADAPAASARPFAAPQAVTSPTAPSAGGLAQVTFALLIVLVAIFAVAWVARRMRGFNNRVGDAINVLADVPLGQKERAVLLKVGSKQILLGVAPGRVNTLHVLEEPLELARPPAGPTDGRPNFKQLMLRSLGK
jgi:flagellar protein FliO/FliZ